jgi:23S rRNA (pseudouridine1915-N3)-methyltransferase
MKIKFIFLGKKKSQYTQYLIDNYVLRLNKYIKSDVVFVDNNNNNTLKIINKLKSRDYLIILDESGRHFNSIQYAALINKSMSTYVSIVLLVGDAYGIPTKILNRANVSISLSNMTFPHLIARLVLVEQTYRAFTIINNHPYHHE